LRTCRAWATPAADDESGKSMSFGALDINLVRGAVLILLILAFAALWAWAWSRNRKEVFREVSMLPLEEDFAQVPPNDSKTERTKE